MGQIACSRKLCLFFCEVNAVRQQSQLRTCREVLAFLVPFCVVCGGWHIVFVSKSDVAFEVHTAQLAQVHLCKRQTIVNLRKGHLCLVNCNIDLQAVSLCGNTLVNHLVYVGVQFPYQVKIAYCQLLLLPQRYHQPVGIVCVVDNLLFCLLDVCLRHLLAYVGHIVGSCYRTSHIDGLCQHC